jgi:Kef-type K+ transport system membrane component KefB
VLHASNAGLILALFLVAVLTKLIGCGIGARLGGFDSRSALHVAIGMVPRGAVGLAITSVGLRYGLMTNTLFPQIVLVILGTTIIAPPFVRWMNTHPVATSPALPETMPITLVAESPEGAE